MSQVYIYSLLRRRRFNAFVIPQVGMEIEVRPGLVSKDSEGQLTCRPIFSRIVSLFAEQNELQFAVPGGLIGKQR